MKLLQRSLSTKILKKSPKKQPTLKPKNLKKKNLLTRPTPVHSTWRGSSLRRKNRYPMFLLQKLPLLLPQQQTATLRLRLTRLQQLKTVFTRLFMIQIL